MYFCSKVITNTATLTYYYNVGCPSALQTFAITDPVAASCTVRKFTIQDSVRNILRIPIPTNNFIAFKNYKNHICFTCGPLHKLCAIKQALRTCTYQIYAHKYYNLLSISANLCTIISYISYERKRYMVFTKPIKLKIWLPKYVNYEPVFNLNLKISQIYLHQINCDHLMFNTIIKYEIEYIKPSHFLP